MITKELCVAQRKYTDKNGNEKTVWLKIGEIHEHNGKAYGVVFPHINLAALPRKEGEDRVFFNLFDPKPKDGQNDAPKAANQAKPSSGAPADFNEFEDDIPFLSNSMAHDLESRISRRMAKYK